MENKGKVILKLSKIINSDFKILSQHFYNTVFLINIFYENSLIGKMIKILNNVITAIYEKSNSDIFKSIYLFLDTDLLKDFSQGGPSEDKLHVLAQQQYEQLTHAMKCKFVISTN